MTRNLGFTDGTAKAWQGRDGRFHATAGENSRRAKLTEDQVRDIKTRPRSGPGRQTHAQVAAEFGVSASQVADIRCGRAWRHVKVGDSS